MLSQDIYLCPTGGYQPEGQPRGVIWSPQPLWKGLRGSDILGIDVVYNEGLKAGAVGSP